MPRRREPLAWVMVGTVFLAALVWACSSTNGEEPDPGSSSGTSGTTSSGSTGGTTSGTTSGGSTSSGSPDADPPPAEGKIPTEPNLKIAFLGDTGTGNDFKAVLQLVKREKAAAVLIQGDLNYAFLGPARNWFSVIDGELGGATKIPYFAAKGNHDVDWGAGYGPGLKTRMADWGVKPETGDPTTVNYSFVFKGLKVVFVDETETNPSRADFVKTRLAGDPHLWKICGWHKNQRNSNVGPKSDEMGWAIYENCRAEGAIIAQAHSHTYSRSKTLANMASQTVDGACTDPFALCVDRGKTFFFDSSIGGQDLRSVETNIAGMPHFASSYAGAFGALFIEFNVGGDPKKAEGYFKTVGDVVIDPPASSGKTKFTITRL
ncbi:MAG: metallophosphoesterase [Deltaproteobacteria bacterium]|nr:metallophosphoesterase [Deltaproteobacteria bacterium]